MKALASGKEATPSGVLVRKSRLTIEPATEAHAAQLAGHLRAEDADEMMVAHGLGPLEGLQLAVKSSLTAKAILDGSRVVALLGVAPTDVEGVASIWLLGGRLVKRFPVAFTRICAEEARRFSESFAVLVNMVWSQNKRALRWLESLGFEVMEPVPFGVLGQPFHLIRLVRRP